jgi:hypothetical protein
MNGLQGLRKSYDELSPTERASMFFSEVAGSQREEVVVALRATKAVEAVQECKAMIAMITVAGHTLTSALVAERAGLALLVKRGSLKEGVDNVVPAWTASVAYALALQKLEEETEQAFFAAASWLDSCGFLAGKVKDWDPTIKVSIDGPLEQLRALWEVGKKMIAT